MVEPYPPHRESMSTRFFDAASSDHENWRDPQHDLEALRQANAEERGEIERFLLSRGVNSYADVEALALLDTEPARHALLAAFSSGPTDVRAAISLLTQNLISPTERTAELLQRIDQCDVYNGLSLTLSQLENDHSPEIIEAMLRRVQREPGVTAVHFAGLLLYLHKQAAEPFDWDQRPFLLRFNPGDEADRQEAFQELCRRINFGQSEPADQ